MNKKKIILVAITCIILIICSVILITAQSSEERKIEANKLTFEDCRVQCIENGYNNYKSIIKDNGDEICRCY